MKLLLADDHALFRQAIRHVLAELGPQTQIFEAETLAAALALGAAEPDLDMVLLDLKMPDSQGIAAVQAFRDRFPALPIVVLSATEECEDIERVLDAGAMGFVPKSSPVPVLLSALRLVADGGVYLPQQLLSRVAPPAPTPLADRPAPVGGHSRIEGLTERQIEVLRLLEMGRANKEIAKDLGLSEGTIKIHLASIYRVLNVRNRIEAVLAAQSLRLPGSKIASKAS